MERKEEREGGRKGYVSIDREAGGREKLKRRLVSGQRQQTAAVQGAHHAAWRRSFHRDARRA